ncbi:ABC transporter permease [Clostridia bacterium]|nr:ABC transporter permease [Clostridia bacterium]
MAIRNLAYFFKQAWLSIRRNKAMSMATVMTITVSLFIVGLFSLIVLNANYFAENIQRSVEISVFLDVDTPREVAVDLQEKIEGISGVEEAELTTKEEGLADLEEKFGQSHDLLTSLGGDNPLPDYYVVKVANPEFLDYVTNAIRKLDYVEKAEYGKEVMDRVFRLVQYVRWIGIVIMSVLCLLAVFLIFITIKLTVFSRQKEIKVMKYVGSSDGFIRAPFVIKGGLLGVAGAFLADIFLYLSYYFFSDSVQGAVSFITPINDQILILKVLAGLLAIGLSIGLFGSNLSIRKYLKV